VSYCVALPRRHYLQDARAFAASRANRIRLRNTAPRSGPWPWMQPKDTSTGTTYPTRPSPTRHRIDPQISTPPSQLFESFPHLTGRTAQLGRLDSCGIRNTNSLASEASHRYQCGREHSPILSMIVSHPLNKMRAQILHICHTIGMPSEDHPRLSTAVTKTSRATAPQTSCARSPSRVS